MSQDLNKIKQFVSSLKAFLLQEFGTYLPEDKISLLNAKNYVDSNFDSNMTDDEIRGDITRSMLKDLINVECNKELNVEAGVTLSIAYGESLEDALIEYYAHNLSVKYGFDINEVPGLKDDLETIKLLNQKLSGSLDSKVFNSDAIKLLESADLKELVQKYDEDAIKKYLEKNKNVAASIGQTQDKDKENDLMKENTNRENAVQIVWLNEKKYIKYVDQDGKVSLTEIRDNGVTEEFYKRKLAELKPGEQLDPEKFKYELSKIVDDLSLTKTEDVKPENLNHKELNMLAFIKSNGKIQEEAKKDIITNSNDMSIHVIESTNDIVVTEDKDYNVDAHIVKDGNAQAERESLQDMEDISSKILTKEEYKELIDRFARGENLTKEELESLRRTSEMFIKRGETLEDIMEEKGAVLSPYKTQNQYGYSFSSFISLIVSVGAICTLILSIYLIYISIVK